MLQRLRNTYSDLRKRLPSSGPWWLGIGGTVLATTAATVVAVRDDARGWLSLGCLAPLARITDTIGWFLLQEPRHRVTCIGGAAAVCAIVFGIYAWWRPSEGQRSDFPPLAVALGLALIGQIFMLHSGWVLGGIFHVEAVMVVAVAGLWRRKGGAYSIADGTSGTPGWWEASALFGIGSVAVFFRYFALNRVVYFFEGELAPYMAGAISLKGMLLANIGWWGPWAPLGLLYYLPIWAMCAVAGSTVLAVRLGSAVVGVMTIVVVYLVVRDVFGRTAALWSAAMLAVDALQVSWGRSDMHPHASTAWPGVLLFGATVRALRTGSTRWYIVVMLLMGLTWHQYPSGQFAVIVPVIAFLVHVVQHRGFLRENWRNGLLIAVGCGLWFLGYPLVSYLAIGEPESALIYMSRLGPRVLGGSDFEFYGGIAVGDLLHRLAENTWILVVGLFTDPPLVFHQTVTPNLDGLSYRALPWFVVAGAFVGLAYCCVRLRTKWSPALLAMVVAGILPAILSDEAWLKRASMLYVVLTIVAALPLAIVTDGLRRRFGRATRHIGAALLAVAFLLWASIWSHLWFSGQYMEYGIPAETKIAAAIDEQLAPETLLILSLWGDYIEGELVYLLSDAITERQPMALYVTDPRLEEWPTLLHEPTLVLEKLHPLLWYWSWLGLGGRMAEVADHRDWTRVVYVMEEWPTSPSDLEVLAGRCPDLFTEAVFLGEDEEAIDNMVLPRYHVWIARCDGHRGLRPPRFAVPAEP